MECDCLLGEDGGSKSASTGSGDAVNQRDVVKDRILERLTMAMNENDPIDLFLKRLLVLALL